ncbi:MAG: hypothetical protein RQ856_05575 [Candidatus Izemoplasmatales bacterium]|nr:hypothetical protein [Candidatus Izemoplasmatales bacterium]
MDRRIKAILIANKIDNLASVELVDYDDGVLEIVQEGRSRYLTLEGEVAEIYVEDVGEQLEDIFIEDVAEPESVENEEILTTIIEEVDDFVDKDKVEDLYDFDIDIDDDFDFQDEIKKEEDLVKIKDYKEEVKEEKELKDKPKKKSSRLKKNKKDDDFINLI